MKSIPKPRLVSSGMKATLKELFQTDYDFHLFDYYRLKSKILFFDFEKGVFPYCNRHSTGSNLS